MKRLLNETLRPTGKWSSKRITAFASFSFSCALSIWSLYRGGMTEFVAIVVGEFLTVCLVCLGISSYQKVAISNLLSKEPSDETSS